MAQIWNIQLYHESEITSELCKCKYSPNMQLSWWLSELKTYILLVVILSTLAATYLDSYRRLNVTDSAGFCIAALTSE